MKYFQIPGVSPLSSQIGFGCDAWKHGYGLQGVHSNLEITLDDQEYIRVIQRAVDLGVTLFDTADVYGFGHSETVLGQALSDCHKEVIIATKFGVAWDDRGRTYRNSSPEHVRKAAEGSLRRLGIESIPLYLMHWQDGRTPLADTIGELRLLRSEGKIQAFGLCNLIGEELHCMEESEDLSAVELGFGLTAPAQVEFADSRDVAWCKDKGIPVLAYGAIGRGVLSGEYRSGHAFKGGDNRVRDRNFKGEQLQRHLNLVKQLQVVGEPYKRRPAEVALNWALSAPGISCVITGITHGDHLNANIATPDWSLTQDEWEYLYSCSLDLI